MVLSTAAPSDGKSMLAVRLALALGQAGLILAAVRFAGWNRLDDAAHATIFMLGLVIPIILSSGLGVMRWRSLIIWACVAAGIVAALTLHAADRKDGSHDFIWPLLAPLTLEMFIAHCLVMAADVQRRAVADYNAYFDAAWKGGVQLTLAALFVGAFWLLLWLGTGLFLMIGITAFATTIKNIWFYIPATALTFGAAVHVTDVKPSLINGMRSLALLLLSWLSPVMTLLICGFLLSLVFTGLDSLWETKRAAAILLGAAAALVILINASYQDGQNPTNPHFVLRIAGRINAAVLLPLVALAAYATYLRVEQYGLTMDRVLLIACLLVASCYAIGYGAAAIRPGRWMRWLEPTNVATSAVILAAILVLFTSIADPARLAVNDQIRRLDAGLVTPEKFDFKFLRFDAGRYGREALEDLAARHDGDSALLIAEMAKTALASKNRYDLDEVIKMAPSGEDDKSLAVEVFPAGAELPDRFLDYGGVKLWLQPYCLKSKGSRCAATFIDFTGDGVAEVVVGTAAKVIVFQKWSDGSWQGIGSAGVGYNPHIIEDFRNDRVKAAQPRILDLKIGSGQYRLHTTSP